MLETAANIRDAVAIVGQGGRLSVVLICKMFVTVPINLAQNAFKMLQIILIMRF